MTADRTLEAKPIKGTTPRAADPAEDADLRTRLLTDHKFRAENLMIVDLLRNDIGQVSVPGTVTVPCLMAVESYPSVHHLVSTVRGRLRDDVTTIAALRALFPAGSMTGAPKLRTMSIIDEVETTPRGAYAGAFGWIGGDGRADLGVIIRSLVTDGQGRWSIGTGGGITVDSVVGEEWAESWWKVSRLLERLRPTRPSMRPTGHSRDILDRLSGPAHRLARHTRVRHGGGTQPDRHRRTRRARGAAGDSGCRRTDQDLEHPPPPAATATALPTASR